MRIKHNGTKTTKATKYMLWLSAADVRRWVFKKYNRRPCSTLAGHRVQIEVDEDGLLDFWLDGGGAGREKDKIDVNEVEAIVIDYLHPALRHLWPVWPNHTQSGYTRSISMRTKHYFVSEHDDTKAVVIRDNEGKIVISFGDPASGEFGDYNTNLKLAVRIVDFLKEEGKR